MRGWWSTRARTNSESSPAELLRQREQIRIDHGVLLGELACVLAAARRLRIFCCVHRCAFNASTLRCACARRPAQRSLQRRQQLLADLAAKTPSGGRGAHGPGEMATIDSFLVDVADAVARETRRSPAVRHPLRTDHPPSRASEISDDRTQDVRLEIASWRTALGGCSNLDQLSKFFSPYRSFLRCLTPSPRHARVPHVCNGPQRQAHHEGGAK